MCQFFSFFITLSVLHLETCMIPLWKVCFGAWFKHILFMTEHDKGLDRAKKLCLALSKTHTCTYNLFTLIK